MVETQLIDVFCDVKLTKKGDKYLEFKCPYCKNYTKKVNGKTNNAENEKKSND